MSQLDQIRAATAEVRKTLPRFTNIASQDQASANARDTIDALTLLVDRVETILVVLDARVTALE